MEFLSLSRRRNPPRETSPAAKSEEKRMFSQAIHVCNDVLRKIFIESFINFSDCRLCDDSF